VAFRDEGAHCGRSRQRPGPTVTTTAANEADVEQIGDLLHGKEQHVGADSGYRGCAPQIFDPSRPRANRWLTANRRGTMSAWSTS
jgi:IS5 family transposase